MTRTVDTHPMGAADAMHGLGMPEDLRPAPAGAGDLLTVTDLARELGISARTLRFYEDKGLIAPRRVGATRVYAARERARMTLVLRGKQLGFSLREIKAYLDLYDADPQHEIQTLALLDKIADRRDRLERQRLAIDQALVGLAALERDARASLARGGTTDDMTPTTDTSAKTAKTRGSRP